MTLREFPGPLHNIPGQDKPIQPLNVIYGGAYAQDEWTVADNFKLTAGVRVDVPVFGDTGYANPNADALTFRDETGAAVQYDSGEAAGREHPVVAAFWLQLRRLRATSSTQIRGGTGVFTGKPALRLDLESDRQHRHADRLRRHCATRTARPVHPNPDRYKPTNVTGAPAASYELACHRRRTSSSRRCGAATSRVDQRLPWGITGTAEFIYNRDVNGIYYINANLPAAQATFAGGDRQPPALDRATASTTSGNAVDHAIVMKNQDVGRNWNIAVSASKHDVARPVARAAAYSYGEAKNTIDPGFDRRRVRGTATRSPAIPNNPGLGFSAPRPATASSSRRTTAASTSASAPRRSRRSGKPRTIGNTSYIFSGDLNGDGATATT